MSVERIPCPDTEQLAASVGGLGRKNSDFCFIFGIPSWLMPLRDRSGQRWPLSGMPYVVAATEVCSRFIGTCRELSPPSSPFPPPFFLAFLNGILRITPFLLWCVPGRLFVAGKICLFLFLFSPFLSRHPAPSAPATCLHHVRSQLTAPAPAPAPGTTSTSAGARHPAPAPAPATCLHQVHSQLTAPARLLCINYSLPIWTYPEA